MKKLLCSLLALTFCINSFGQMVITEIMYNPPEAGSDSLEFIEFQNNSANLVNLDNWYLTEGVGMTFGDIDVPAGGFVVIAVDSLALYRTLGYAGAYEWNSGALSNGGEDIVLLDSLDNEVDSVDYDDVRDWPDLADGAGYSLELLDVNSDNREALNWAACNTSTGVVVNGHTVYASPGKGRFVPKPPSVNFELSDTRVPESNASYWFKVNASHFTADDTATIVIEAGSNNASAGTDYVYMRDTLHFNVNDTTDSTILTIIDNMVDAPNKKMWLYFSDVSGATTMSDTLTIGIVDDDFSFVPITDLRKMDANGVSAHDGDTVWTGGIVNNSVNFNDSCSSTTLQSQGAGLGIVWCQSNYEPTLGDSLYTLGIVSQTAGRLHIAPVISLSRADSNLAVDTAEVTAISEQEEGRLLLVKGVALVDTNQWTNSGAGFNVDVSNGTETITLYIDNGTDLYNMPYPKGTFDVMGIGSQHDEDAPFTEHYRLDVRSSQDIMNTVNTQEVVAKSVSLYPNPATTMVRIGRNEAFQNIQVFNTAGIMVLNQDMVPAELNVADWEKGLYMVMLQGRDGQVHHIKLMVK